jgi:hypothetical protein
MAAGVCNLLIQQGETFSRTITITDNQAIPVPINLTGYTARASIRPAADSSTKTCDFVCTFATDRATGVIVISLADTVTSAIATTGKTAYDKLAKYQWDMEIISSGGVVTRLLNGSVEVSPEVTRA